VIILENSLSLEEFKLLALQYQRNKKRDREKYKKKADEDLYCYLTKRSLQIKKRCGYF
jgi:hypothetical protein